MRIITVKIETDSEESFDLIKDDIKQELSCCWNLFDIIEISEGDESGMDDLISRQDVLTLAKDLTLQNGCKHRCIDATMIHELPSAQRWIPCSERLPEDLEEVNVTWVNHEPEPYYAFIKDKPFTATAVYYKEKWYWYSSTCVDWLAEYGKNPNDEIDDRIEIIAWMPLPEPYKEENNG